MATKLANFRHTLYRLTRDFGLPITVYRMGTNTTNLQTGAITRTYTTYNVKRAVVLPVRYYRDLARLFGTGNFDYGGYFDVKHRLIIIRRKDLSISLNINDHIEFNSLRWEIKEIEELEENRSYVLIVENIKGALLEPWLEPTEELLFGEWMTHVRVRPAQPTLTIGPYKVPMNYFPTP
jgi:hypothetical protein